MAGSPTRWVNRAENAERDMPTSLASDPTVHSRAGSRWIEVRARGDLGAVGWRPPYTEPRHRGTDTEVRV